MCEYMLNIVIFILVKGIFIHSFFQTPTYTDTFFCIYLFLVRFLSH